MRVRERIGENHRYSKYHRSLDTKTNYQFWAVLGKKNCHKYATFKVSFLCFQGQKNFLIFFKYCSVRIKKLYSKKVRKN